MKFRPINALRPLPASRRLTAGLELLAVPGVLAWLLLAPPAHGTMVVIPLDGSGVSAASLVSGAEVQLLGRGPTQGSIVVKGDRAQIRQRLSGQASLILASPDTGCLGAKQ